MQKRRERQNDREMARKALALLAEFPHRCSEMLCASILLEESYPELSDTLERMAQVEAEQFRRLGGMMLRAGMNPPLRMLTYGGRGRCPMLVSAEKGEVRNFFFEMKKETERIARDARLLLTAPDWEGEDGSLRFLERQEEQLRMLMNVLS